MNELFQNGLSMPNPISQIAFNNLKIIFIAHFFVTLILSFMIKNRFNNINVYMKSRVIFTLIRGSFFWQETKMLNSTIEDPKVSKFILLNRIFWSYAFVSFVFFVISMTLLK